MADNDGVNRIAMFPFHARTKEECYAELDCGTDLHNTGLTTAEAAKRLEQFGHNKLMEREKVTIWQRIWHQVANVLVGILVFVAIVSGIQAIRYAFEGDGQNTITNSIQCILIIVVITYVLFKDGLVAEPYF